MSQWPELTGEVMIDEASGGALVQETMSDEMLAQLLQLQFDQEYDRDLGKEEAKYNGTSKGNVFFFLFDFTNYIDFKNSFSGCFTF
jgi:RIO kinase 3